MIWHPQPGQRVRLVYAAKRSVWPTLNGRCGTIERAGKGPGPVNALVRLDEADRIWAGAENRLVVPRGNLRLLAQRAHDA